MTKELLWELANSPAVISALAGAVVYLLNRLYAKKPLWKKFEGHIISGIRFAEKQIPDDADNKAVARADTAFKYVLEVFNRVHGRDPSAKEAHELSEGIRIKHDEVS